MKLVYSSRALAQLASVYDYLTARSPAAAANVTASIAQTIARLKHLPELGKLTDERDVYVIVEPEYLYRVFYRFRENQVIVLRIMHGRQS
jgi:toxin ParE1/3/4